MLVEAQVSSMNTSRSGSRSSWLSNQAARRLRISGRSCSAACAVFFLRVILCRRQKRQSALTLTRAPFSAKRAFNSGQARLQLGQGDVGNLGQGRVDQLGMGLGATREPIAALRLWPATPAGPAHPLPADGAGRAHAKPGRRLTAGQARVDGGQNTRAKVEG